MGRAGVCCEYNYNDIDRACRGLVRALGEAGWLKAVVPAAYGGLSQNVDVRALCLAREILAWHDSLADFAFAMQGLGTGSLALFGSDALKAKYLPAIREGRRIGRLTQLESLYFPGRVFGSSSTNSIQRGYFQGPMLRLTWALRPS
jgi:Acyl-CoA dehydrogenase, N-terminal domain